MSLCPPAGARDCARVPRAVFRDFPPLAPRMLPSLDAEDRGGGFPSSVIARDARDVYARKQERKRDRSPVLQSEPCFAVWRKRRGACVRARPQVAGEKEDAALRKAAVDVNADGLWSPTLAGLALQTSTLPPLQRAKSLRGDPVLRLYRTPGLAWP